MSLYLSHPDIPAYHPKTYSKRRPKRFDWFTGLEPVPAATTRALGGLSNPTYAEFITGNFDLVMAEERMQA